MNAASEALKSAHDREGEDNTEFRRGALWMVDQLRSISIKEAHGSTFAQVVALEKIGKERWGDKW